MNFSQPLLWAIFACLFHTIEVSAQDIVSCGNPFLNSYGPFDYRTATPDQRLLVESVHFTPAVESLRTGSTGSVGGDIDYTLRAFPNHPRALMAMVRLGKQEKSRKPRGANYTVECYLERALAFRPDDIDSRQVRGIYWSNERNFAAAIKDFQYVVEQQPSNANAHYNLGLAYFEVKNYPAARAEAKAAEALRFPLDGLQKKLKAVGQWQE